MEPFVQTRTSILELERWQVLDPYLQIGFTTRNGGYSHQPFTSFNLGLHVNDRELDVLKNRQQLADILSFPMSYWVMGEQVHATEIQLVTEKDIGKGAKDHTSTLQGVDGLITNEANVLLTAMFADCVPLYFWDPSTNWLGIAHAGWRGTVGQMAAKMVEKLKQSGADSKTLRIAIGPAISSVAYEIDQHVYEQIPMKWRNKVTVSTGISHYLFDMQQLHYDILLEQGIDAKHIYRTSYCTYSNELFFSHRRDNGKTGRMLGYIGRNKL